MRKSTLPADDLVPDRDQTRLLAQVAPQLAHLVRREVVLVRVDGHVVLKSGEREQKRFRVPVSAS